MTYDRIVRIYTLDKKTDALARRIVPKSTHYCAELTVYHRTYFERLQAGDRVDAMLQMPRDDMVRAEMFAIPEDGEVYRITEAQQTVDRDNMPITVMTLYREEAAYDIVRP